MHAVAEGQRHGRAVPEVLIGAHAPVWPRGSERREVQVAGARLEGWGSGWGSGWGWGWGYGSGYGSG